ncbi:sugar-binding protein [Kiritimatiellaeota bacterium B1221]|nr:sugar-binding protein [Kiritimatiellaeota bacterium B1221]
MKNTQWTKLFFIGLCAGFAAQIQAERIVEREIPQMMTAPTIDGDLAEWKDLASFKLMPPSWKHKYDHSAQVWMAWDARNFYFAVKVYDQKLINANDPAKGLYMGDQVRLRLSAQPENQDVNFGPADREIFVAPVSADGSAACTYKVGGEDLKVVAAEGGEITWAATNFDRGYIVEYKIPAAALGVEELKKGEDAISYNLAIYDRDKDSADEWKQTHIRISSSSVKKQPREWPLVRLSEKVMILED